MLAGRGVAMSTRALVHTRACFPHLTQHAPRCMCIPNSVPREWRVASASSSSSAKPARRRSSGRSVLILASWWANFLVVLLLVLAYFFASLSPLSQICPALANLRPAAADQLFAIGRTWSVPHMHFRSNAAQKT